MAVVSDNFNRANGTLASPWIIRGTLQITSNAVEGTGADSWQLGYWDVASQAIGPDQYAQVSISAPPSFSGVGACVLIQPASPPSSFYWLKIRAGRAEVCRVDALAETVLSSDLTAKAAGTYRLEADVFSDRVELRAYYNGTLITALGTSGVTTDTDAGRYTTGQPGIISKRDAGTFIDDFEGGDLAVSPTLTDVDTDEILGSTQAAFPYTGTNLGATTADRTISLVQGATVIPLTQVTGNATGGTANMAGFATGGAGRYGVASKLRAVVGSNTAELDLAAVSGQNAPITPPSGRSWVTFGTLDPDVTVRISGVPVDIAPGDQFEYDNQGGTITVLNTGVVTGTSGSTTSLTGRLNDGVWGADATISITSGEDPPVVTPTSTVCDDTAGGVVRASLRLIGAIASGETPTADELQDGLCLLQDLLQHWSTHNLAVYGGAVESFQTVAGQATYTIGPSGNWNTTRPVRISGDAVCTYQGVDFPVEQIGQDEYNAVPVKSTSSPIVEQLLYVNDYPLGRITLHPVPSAVVTITLNSDRVLTSVQNTATPMSFPPGYKLALRYALAMLLAPEYGITPSPDIRETAKSTFAAIKRANKGRRKSSFDLAIGGDGLPGDWRSG